MLGLGDAGNLSINLILINYKVRITDIDTDTYSFKCILESFLEIHIFLVIKCIIKDRTETFGKLKCLSANYSNHI